MRTLSFLLGLGLLAPVPALAQGEGPTEVIADTLRTLYVGEPVSYGSLTLFPLDHPFVADHTHYWTVEEALARGTLRLTETNPQRQNLLLLQASAGRDQFGGALGGWDLGGGRRDWGGSKVQDQFGGGGGFGQGGGGIGGGGQNRGFGRNFLLPGDAGQGGQTPFLPGGPLLAQGGGNSASIAAGATVPGGPGGGPILLAADIDHALRTTGLPVPVFCVEEKRLAGLSRTFAPTFTLAPNAVRRAMLGELTPETQQAVWQAVSEELQRAGTPSPTRALAAVYEPPPFRAAVEEAIAYVGRQPVWNDDTVGLAAVINGRVVAVDVYVNPDLFRRMAPRLIAAHAVEAVRNAPAPPPSRDAVYAFLKALASARREPQPAFALGQDYVLRSPAVVGEALVHQGRVIHAAGFPLEW